MGNEDRSREHVSIMRVGQLQLIDEPLVSGNQTIGHGQVHQLLRTTELIGLQVRAPFENRSHPLGVNLLSPTGAKEIRQSNTRQQIPQGCRMEYTSIVDGNEARQALVSQSQFLCLRGEKVAAFTGELRFLLRRKRGRRRAKRCSSHEG